MPVRNPRIEVIAGRCMGAGNCVDVAPDYFDQKDSDGMVVALRDIVVSGDESIVTRAVDVCPVAALVVTQTS